MEVLLNKDKALANLGGDSALLSALIGIYHEDTPLLMSQLLQSVEHHDFDSAKLAAHSLKGILSTFFADSAVTLLAEIENCCRERNLNNLEFLIEKLPPQLEVVAQQLHLVASEIVKS